MVTTIVHKTPMVCVRSDSCRSAVAAFQGIFAVFAENIYLGSRVRPVESEPRRPEVYV